MLEPNPKQGMRIISTRSDSTGYAGFIEEEDSYVYFNFPRHGKLKRLLVYDKRDYTNYGHFLAGITKFFPQNFLLKEPVPLEACTIEELDRICRRITPAVPFEPKGNSSQT